jgi:hypothetical protein
MDPSPEYWEGKRGACVGTFQQVIAGNEPKWVHSFIDHLIFLWWDKFWYRWQSQLTRKFSFLKLFSILEIQLLSRFCWKLLIISQPKTNLYSESNGFVITCWRTAIKVIPQ